MKTILAIIFYTTVSMCTGQTGLLLTDYPSGGSIGTAPATFETNAFLKIPQTTAGQTLTLPNPTNPAAGKNVILTNTGSTSFTISPGGVVPPNCGVTCFWTGSGWVMAGSGMTAHSMAQNLVMASPSSGSGVPNYRSITTSDIPNIPYSQVTGGPAIIAFTNLSGTPLSITKFATGTITPSTGNGYSIDISGVGLTNLLGYSIEPIKNTSTATSSPKVSVKSESASAIVVNIIEGNAALQLGLLLGVSEQFANTSGLTLKVVVYGN